jgi:ABC-type transporter Mla subunit MlaD
VHRGARAALLLAMAAALLTGCRGNGASALRTPDGSFDFEAQFGTNLPPAMNAGSPVRIDGVNVGTVTKVTRTGSGAVVQMRIQVPPAPHIGTDALIKVRPRLFLEGNWFIDIDPGNATVLENGDRLPASQTDVWQSPFR